MGAPTISTFFKRAGKAPCGEQYKDLKIPVRALQQCLMGPLTVQVQSLGFLLFSPFLPSRGSL